MSKAIAEAIGKIQEIMEDKIVEESTGITFIEMTIMTEVGIGLETGCFQGTMTVIELGSTSNSRLRSGSTANTNRDRIRSYRSREYDHFTRDCPTTREEREIEQLQQMLNLEENQTSLLTNSQNSTVESSRVSPLNHMNSRDGTTTFLPLNSKIGGHVNNNRPSIGQFLSREQTKHIYKKTESGGIINTEAIQQELEQERQLDRIDDMNRETNPYKELIVNNAEKVEPLMTNGTVVYPKQCFKLHTVSQDLS